MDKGELFKEIEGQFGQIEYDFYQRQLNWMQTNKKLSINNTNSIALSEIERNRIFTINEGIEFQEQYFIYEIKNLLKEYDIDSDYNDVIQEIIKIYKAAYKRDLEEIKENPEQNGFETTAICNLREYLFKKIDDEDKCSKAIKDIIEICEYNDYMQRISAGEVFSNLTNIPRIENYIRRQPKPLFLDTSVLLYLLCVFIQDTKTYDNIFYNAVRDLFNYKSQGQITLVLKTTKQYVRESAFQLLNAFRLVPFSKLEYFSDLGGTSNIFYSYYIHLSKQGELEYGIDSYEDFLEELNIEHDVNDDSFLDYISEFVEEVLESNDIEIVDVAQYEYDYNSKKRFEEIKCLFEKHHLSKEDNRADITVKNDTLMFCELFNDENYDIEPTILTWDSSFYEVRKNYHRKHRNLSYWHLFRPSKFLDHLSLIKFELNSKALSKDILSIIEDDFNIQDKVKSLNDVMVRIVNLENKSGIKLTKEISKLRSKHIFQLNNQEPSSLGKEQIIPIDRIVTNLSSYYRNKEGEYTFDDFKAILTNEQYIDEIIKLWTNETEKIGSGKYSKEAFYNSMDNVIKKSLY